MSTLVCGNNCADLSWDFFGVQLQAAGFLWAALLVGGFGIAFTSVTSNTDGLRNRLEYVTERLRASRLWSGAVVLLALAQCVIYCFRTYTKAADDITFAIEAAACLLYLINLVPAWVHAHLLGFWDGIVFMFGPAIPCCLLFSSIGCMPLVKVHDQKSWSSLSFVSALQLFEAWQRLLDAWHVDREVLRWQATDVIVSTGIAIIFAAMTMLTLETLGDPEMFAHFNKPKWNTVSAVYFVFMTIATVGYGDLAPKTGLGRLFSVIALFGGICALVLALHRVLVAISLNRSGGGSFDPLGRVRHILVVGTPTGHMIQNFIEEVLHPDHAEDAEDLHIVFLLSTAQHVDSVNRYLRQKADIVVSQRVRAFVGSALEREDLLRVSAPEASAFFILPNLMCKDPLQEDTENIIRMVAMQRYMPTVRTVLLLMKQDHKQLLTESAMNPNVTLLSFDQFKLEIVGKSCEVPGFSTFICNLCKSIGTDEEPVEGGTVRESWQQDYERGSANELYEVELSAQYAVRSATFSEVVLDVLEHTGGFVYLIGVVETGPEGRRVLVNPGPNYPIKAASQGFSVTGIFIAPDRESILQCEGGMVFLGRRERPPKVEVKEEVANGGTKEALRALAAGDSSKDELTRRIFSSLTPEQKQRAEQLVSLIKQHRRGAQPTRPPLKLLAKGGHILVMCVGAKGVEDLRLGIHHFVRPLRQGDDAEAPIVVLAPQLPRDWQTVDSYREVYFLKGSPLVLFDIQRANFEAASAIFIVHVGCGRAANDLAEPWMVDSEVICCARLVESHLPTDSPTLVVVDLASDRSHPFVPMRRSKMLLSSAVTRSSMTRSTTNLLQEEAHSADGDGHSSRRLLGLRAAAAAAPNGTAQLEYYQQVRFAAGQMFVGTLVTSLVANTFFSPSLCDLVDMMISARIVNVEVPRTWMGKTYVEFFDHLLWSEELLPVGVYRSTEHRISDGPGSSVVAKMKKRSYRLGYIFTAPPGKDTVMVAGDRVICFAGPKAGHEK